jgi:iron complex outermembrane receptor protein
MPRTAAVLAPAPRGLFMMMLALLLAPLGARAQSAPAPLERPEEQAAGPLWSDSLSLEELLQVELSSPSKQRQTARQAPGVASVVTREQIRQFGWMTLDDILFSQPGFFPAHDYERTVVAARGLSESWNNNHLLLLVDGVPMNDNEAGTAYTGDITPLFLVKSVEIIRGPGSALYGSSATNGVLAINTLSSPRTLSEDERLLVNSEARLQLGDRESLNVDAVAATQSQHVSAVIGFRHHRTGGDSYLSHDGSGRTDDTGALQRFLIRDRHGSEYLFLKLEPRKALEGLSLQYHLQSWNHSTGHGWLFWAPDVEGPMREQRHLAVLRYHSGPEGWLQQEYVLRFQQHRFERSVRFYPSGAFDGYYPAGVNEALETSMNDVFGRAQLLGTLAERLTLLGGVEYSAFLYDGDEVHYSNAALMDEEAPPSETLVPLGPFFEPILGHPVNNLGVYAQLAWGEVLGLPLSLTAGVRYDSKFFHYRDPLDSEGAPARSKTYDQFSPRLALVYTPRASLSLKLQSSSAFRAPAPVELFGANTWMLASNIEALRPERVITHEFTADWTVNPGLNGRGTLFHTTYDNLIGYSDANLSSNLFSRTIAGLEAELQGEVDFGARGRLLASGSYTYVRLLSEQDGNGGNVASVGHLTWAPEHLAKAGVSYRWKGFSLALQGRYQGTVKRRESDMATPVFAAARPQAVPAWVRFDVNARYQLTDWSSVGVKVSNLLDAESYLVKIGDFPFDYRMEGRRVFGSLEFQL